MRPLLLVVAASLLAATLPRLTHAQDVKPGADPTFKPAIVSVDLTSHTVRPGDLVGITYRFRNDGTKPAAGDYMVFVHLEYPDKDCAHLVVNMDHPPTHGTSTWEPGQEVSDGPFVFPAPSEKGDVTYFIHVGIYAPQLDGVRLLDQYVGELKVDRNAPPAKDIAPAPISEEEKSLRRKNLVDRIKDGVTLDDPKYAFTVDKNSGAWQLLDKVSGVLWGSNPEQPVFGEVQFTGGQTQRTSVIRKFASITKEGSGLTLTAPLEVDGKPIAGKVVFTVEPVKDPVGVRIHVSASAAAPWRIVSTRILDDALWTTDDDQGYSILPERLGVLDHADAGLPSVQRFQTYANTSLALYGAVKRGSALLVAWPHPETELTFKRSWPDSPLVSGRRMNSIALTFRGAADTCSIHPLGNGNYCDIALAYRKIAAQRGLLRTWAEKRKTFPNVDKLIGAADFKPFVFSRSMPRDPGGTVSTYVGFTFAEAAQCAEHWSKDLGIDKAMVVLAGWIHRGYDNQHPDILPACPECGGNDELIKASKRIKDCGFLFGLHDNYQDMYKDAPSWDEKYINRDARGNLKMGGFWGGGQSYQVCAIEQVKLAQRPQNLPEVERLFGPTIYFIDTVFAWPLVTCEAKEHPMTLADDMHYKSLLCDEAKKHFGLFGSEEGREWAVPHADYQEGIFGAKASGDPRQIVIPMQQMIYGDCTMFYTHQSDRLGVGDTKKFLDHIIYGAMPVYNFGSHLYWKEPNAQGLPVLPLPPKVEPGVGSRFRITYRWQVNGKIPDDLFCFVHFTHPRATRDEGIAYQGDHQFAVPTSQWQPGTIVEDGPWDVEVPALFLGESELMFGLLDKNGQRVALDRVPANGTRYDLGTVTATPDGITFRPNNLSRTAISFARGNDGWGQGLCDTDRFIKNTYEVLSYLQRLTAEHPMTQHEFVTPDRSVEKAVFGKNQVTVIVNYGPKEYSVNGAVLPPNGFLIESPTFVAFHATKFGDHTYDPPALFTLRSLDGKPLAQSKKIRIFHGFGDAHVSAFGKEWTVAREAEVQ